MPEILLLEKMGRHGLGFYSSKKNILGEGEGEAGAEGEGEGEAEPEAEKLTVSQGAVPLLSVYMRVFFSS